MRDIGDFTFWRIGFLIILTILGLAVAAETWSTVGVAVLVLVIMILLAGQGAICRLIMSSKRPLTEVKHTLPIKRCAHHGDEGSQL